MTVMKMFIGADEIFRMQRVALGQEPADIILSGGTVLNVYTGELLEDHEILIAGERIAYVGPDNDFPVGPATLRLNLSGQVVIPGLIDSHCHIDYWAGFREFISLSLPHGTTTVITETSATANRMGIAGVRAFLAQFRKYPLRFFATAPVISYMCSLRDQKPAVTTAEMSEILEYPEILGLGEIYWSRVVDGTWENDLNELVAKARSLGKTVEGHGAGAKNGRLNAYADYGVDSCHEPINAEDVRARLRLGLATMIREGSHRRELDAVIPGLTKMDINLRRAIFVTDGIWPNDLAKYGHMDHIVRKAISLGLNQITAIQMATLNAAEHFRLDADLGGIAPGKCADLVIIPSIDNVNAQMVISRGRVVARQGRLEVDLQAGSYPEELCQNIKLPIVTPEYFRIEATGSSVRTRVMDMVNEIVNQEAILEMPVIDGEVQLADDILKIAVIDRYEGTGRRTLGFIKGYGLRQGAIAVSMSFDEGNTVVIGCNDLDMAATVNRLRVLKEGMVYCNNGRVVELPLSGYDSVPELAVTDMAESFDSLIAVMREMGCRLDNPLFTPLTVTFTAIPSLRLTIRGHWLSKENRFVDLFI